MSRKRLRLVGENAGPVYKQAQYNFLYEFQHNPVNKFIRTIPAMIERASHWEISPDLWTLQQDGMTVWEQAVRNAIKHHKKGGWDAIKEGTLLALIGGGCCLPGCIPKGRQAYKYSRGRSGFNPPRMSAAEINAIRRAEEARVIVPPLLVSFDNARMMLGEITSRALMDLAESGVIVPVKHKNELGRALFLYEDLVAYVKSLKEEAA